MPKESYYRLFTLIRNEAAMINCVFNPLHITIDFEAAVKNALWNSFGVIPKGCIFHFAQCVYRKVQGLGLAADYNANNPPLIRKWVRRLMTLPLVPPLRLDQAFQAICEEAPQIPQADELHAYMLQTWMDPVAPLFERTMWNQFGAVDRTSNACEGFHSKLNAMLSRPHTSVFLLIELLRKTQLEMECFLRQYAFGAPPRRRRNRYENNDRALRRLMDRYIAGGICNVQQLLTYIDACSNRLA